MPRSTELDTRVLGNILKNLPGNKKKTVAKAAFVVEERAKINIQQMDAIDTGALLNSTTTSLKDGDRMQGAIADALEANPDVVITPLPVPRDDGTAYTGPTVEYGAEVHFGTGTMAGRPYLINAVRETEAEFRKMWEDVVTDGR